MRHTSSHGISSAGFKWLYLCDIKPCHSLYYSICDCTDDRTLNVRVSISVVSNCVFTPFYVSLRTVFLGHFP